MKTIDEMITVMQAFKDGKKIEFICNGKWEETNSPLWNWDSLDYRVKPEPKYVPYDSVDEVDRSKWVRKKGAPGMLRAITIIDTDKNWVYVAQLHWVNTKEIFEMFEYEDGTPCGKLVEGC